MYLQQSPSPNLDSFVECYWSVDAPLDSGLTYVMPDGSINLIFNFGAPHLLANPVDLSEFVSFKKCWISGIRSRFLCIGPTDGTRVIGVRFKPGGLFPFLKCPISAFSHQVIEMDQIWGSRGEFVHEQMYEIQSPHARFSLLEGFLIALLEDSSSIDTRVSYSLGFLSNPEFQSKELVADLGISQKHLNRLFDKYVGINPKSLNRINRFQTAVRSIERHVRIDWADLALECGYYDQSHFVADFKRIAGVTPVDYLHRLTPDHNFIEA